MLDPEYAEKIFVTGKLLSHEKGLYFDDYKGLEVEIKREVKELRIYNKTMTRKRGHHQGGNKRRNTKKMATSQKEN